ncbi:GNAT family N-acetyltransferase [Methanococcoides burtonii]|uniref:Acetyltransferase (GNAT) family protein n=1 Tax=Methanococcoides burtonii (strain DSM 6242 / NBRC 107633 / OCM 468 / ACE-M) TaxID=259564 RepID=Q12W35_METBU|nr:GNAT family N-acetyltransferase [Methanococcoides burtonii]ABE52341.1 Acetyltransferase (GNAT) family protein [Methanococcoides burtonii DSM 6242]
MNENVGVAIRDAEISEGGSIEGIMGTYFLDIDDVPIEDFIVAEVEGKIVGVAAVSVKECCEVHSIAVHPTYRGLGIGSKMISRLIEDVSHERLYVRTTSPLFFRKMGFVELPMSEKTSLWQDCCECGRYDNCKQYVLCMVLKEV